MTDEEVNQLMEENMGKLLESGPIEITDESDKMLEDIAQLLEDCVNKMEQLIQLSPIQQMFKHHRERTKAERMK